MKRKNGLETPYNPLQILTWFLLPFLIVGFALTIPRVLPAWLGLGVFIPLYVVGVVGTVWNGYMACWIDPCDLHLKPKPPSSPSSNSNNNNTSNSSAAPEAAPEENTYCYVCAKRCHRSSKHCRYCNKCVYKFDHHCLWLNTCIGGVNYPYFWRTVCSVLFFTTVQLVGSSLCVGFWAFEYLRVRERSEDVYGDNLFFVIFTSIYTLILLTAVSMITQLFSFHLMLQHRGLSTYDYIILDAKKVREKEKLGARRYEESLIRIGNGERLLCGRFWGKNTLTTEQKSSNTDANANKNKNNRGSGKGGDGRGSVGSVGSVGSARWSNGSDINLTPPPSISGTSTANVNLLSPFVSSTIRVQDEHEHEHEHGNEQHVKVKEKGRKSKSSAVVDSSTSINNNTSNDVHPIPRYSIPQPPLNMPRSSNSNINSNSNSETITDIENNYSTNDDDDSDDDNDGDNDDDDNYDTDDDSGNNVNNHGSTIGSGIDANNIMITKPTNEHPL